MKESYNLNELAMITSLTTRTLRNYLRLGALNGEKQGGAWTFTPEDVDAFLSNPAVRKSIETRRSALVFDFLADDYKRANRACVILDCPVDAEESVQLSRFFCESACEASDIELRIGRNRGITRVILSGGEDQVMDMLNKYYNR